MPNQAPKLIKLKNQTKRDWRNIPTAAYTKVAAEVLGQQEKIGTLEKGKLADIVAVKGDPIKNIALLQAIDFVMKNGKVYKSR